MNERSRLVIFVVIAVLFCFLAACSQDEPPLMRVGVHLQACDYSFTAKDLLDEGSDEILKLGADSIGVYLGSEYKEYYNGIEEEALDLESLAKTEAYDRFLNKNFLVYSLTCYAFANGLDSRWQQGIESYDPEAAYREVRGLVEYLLRRFAGTGKTFIIKNWEGDWHLLGGYNQGDEPSDTAVEAMIEWLQSRIKAIEDARAAVGVVEGVSVFSAVEFNLVAKAEGGGRTLLTSVVPHLKADLYSYSSWDSLYQPQKIIPRLDFIKRFAADSESFGRRNVMLGELGAPDGGPAKVTMLRWAMEAARSWGVPYCFFWQLYDNECDGKRYYPAGVSERRTLICRGFWLIDKMGRRTPSWYMLSEFLHREEP